MLSTLIEDKPIKNIYVQKTSMKNAKIGNKVLHSMLLYLSTVQWLCEPYEFIDYRRV